MNEIGWFAKAYYVEDSRDRDKIILQFIKPLFDELENEGNVDTFHFSRLGRPFKIEVRIKGQVGEVENMVHAAEQATGVQDLTSKIERTKWKPTESDLKAVTEDHLELLTHEREYMSRRTIELIDAGLDADELCGFFARQSHLFANNLGFKFSLGRSCQPMPERT